MQEVFPVQNRTKRCLAGGSAPEQGFQLCFLDIEEWAGRLKATHSPGTVSRYRKALLDFYDFLPEDKRVLKDTVTIWLEGLKGRYSNYQVNMATSAYNALMRYVGHEEYQLSCYIVKQMPSRKEVTREGYFRLLATAKRMRKPLAYLVMRSYACTGIDTSELLSLTVEEVQGGVITTEERTLHLPSSLQKELLNYALHKGIRAGRIFIDRAGRPMKAAALRSNISAVSKAAGFSARVACAYTLQKLYETARSELETGITERLMLERFEREQVEHCWGG